MATKFTKFERLRQVSMAFTPATPVNKLDLFADRSEQLVKCIDALFQEGRHIALYGERGVGKTSLANIVPQLINNTESDDLLAVRIDCNTLDGYNSIWRKVFRELKVEAPVGLKDMGPIPIDPEDIRFALQEVHKKLLIVVDEFDRVEDNDALTLLADTVKTLSDHHVSATLMFVGVAGSVDSLLGEHESIVRNIEQIPMPRMSPVELTNTIEKGFSSIDELEISPEACERIITAAEGLPHFAHVLGLEAAQTAVRDDRGLVVLEDVTKAEQQVMGTHSMVSEYRAATQSHQPGHLFEEVLIACAYAPRDNLGCFKAADLRGPLSLITGQEVATSRYQRHLRELSESRGTLLRQGSPRHYVYSFGNPLLQPFVKMVARSKKIVTHQQEKQLVQQQAEAGAAYVVKMQK